MYNRITMSAPREFTMNYTFKLVYTNIVYNVKISSHETLHDLFYEACHKFTPHINYNKYYIDYVVNGQDKCELAEAIDDINILDHTLWYEFGDRWKQISFYVRPMDRETDSFIRMDRYIEETLEVARDRQVSDIQFSEFENRETDTLGTNLPLPSGLIIQVD